MGWCVCLHAAGYSAGVFLLVAPVVADGVEAGGDELSVDIDQPAAQLGEDKRPVG